MIPNTSPIQPTASDIGLRLFMTIVLIVLNIALFIKLHKKEITSYQQPIRLLSFGISFLALAVFGNSVMAHRWDLEYITAFLTMVNLSPVIIFQGMAVFGYTSLSFAITSSIVVLLKRQNNDKCPNKSVHTDAE